MVDKTNVPVTLSCQWSLSRLKYALNTHFKGSWHCESKTEEKAALLEFSHEWHLYFIAHSSSDSESSWPGSGITVLFRCVTCSAVSYVMLPTTNARLTNPTIAPIISETFACPSAAVR